MTPVCCTSLSMRPWKDVLPVHARMYKGGRLSTGIWRTPYSEKEGQSPGIELSCSDGRWENVFGRHARMYKGGRLSTGIWRTPYSEKEPSGGIELSCSDGRREKSRPGACSHAQGNVLFPRHMADAIQREGRAKPRNRAVMLRRTAGKRFWEACPPGSVTFDSGIRR